MHDVISIIVRVKEETMNETYVAYGGAEHIVVSLINVLSRLSDKSNYR